MINSKAIMIVFFVLSAWSAMAQQGIQLKLNVGDKWYHEQKRTSNRQDMLPDGSASEINDENILGTTYQVLEAGKGTYDIKVTFSVIKFKATSPGDEGEITFDSQKQEDMDGDDGEAVKSVIGKSYVFTIDANTRKLLAIKVRPVNNEVQTKPQGPLNPAINLFPRDDDQLKRRVEAVFGGTIPDEKLVKALKWDKTYIEKKQGITNTINMSYTVNRIEGDKIYIDEVIKHTMDGVPAGTEELGEFRMSGLSNGTGSFYVDLSTGLKSEAKSIIRGEQTFKTPNGSQKTNLAVSYVETVKKLTAN